MQIQYHQMKLSYIRKLLRILQSDTDRLKKLEKENIIKRQKETIDKISVTYALTKKGQGIIPVIKEISKFANTYL